MIWTLHWTRCASSITFILREWRKELGRQPQLKVGLGVALVVTTKHLRIISIFSIDWLVVELFWRWYKWRWALAKHCATNTSDPSLGDSLGGVLPTLSPVTAWEAILITYTYIGCGSVLCCAHHIRPWWEWKSNTSLPQSRDPIRWTSQEYVNRSEQ